jgi:hypothetical protein
MGFINLTPHSIEVFPVSAFVGLEQSNPTTWVADSVEQSGLVASFESKGVARISVSTVDGEPIEGIPTVRTTYGDAIGIPDEIGADDVLIVSLPMQSMAKASGHPLAGQMVAPYQVVRSRANGSMVLGCVGFTY